MNTLVFDIETVPDTDSVRKFFDLGDLPDTEVADFMFAKSRERIGNSDFIKHHLQKIVAISVVLLTKDKLNLWSLGDVGAGEKDIIQRFFDGIDRYTPRLVSWNGGGFDLPVLHYRALLHGIVSMSYWETGDSIQDFKWNNYLNRFHDRHTDLMDVIAGYNPRAFAPLSEVAMMLGFPGKLGMDGGKVWDSYLAGEIVSIRDYCETDVLNTYLIFLRYELMCGQRSTESYDMECRRLKELLREDGRPHVLEFLRAWG